MKIVFNEIINCKNKHQNGAKFQHLAFQAFNHHLLWRELEFSWLNIFFIEIKDSRFRKKFSMEFLWEWNLLVTDDLSTELRRLVVDATFIACSKNATRSELFCYFSWNWMSSKKFRNWPNSKLLFWLGNRHLYWKSFFHLNNSFSLNCRFE